MLQSWMIIIRDSAIGALVFAALMLFAGWFHIIIHFY